MKIEQAKKEDASQIAAIERICFPQAEAASLDSITKRLEVFGNHFFVAKIDDHMIGFINGMVTNHNTIEDEMYEDASLHREDGFWQSIFGLDVLPEYRNHGYAAKLMEYMIRDAKENGRKGCILTCKQHLVHYYEKIGYVCLGVSASTHGDTVWYDMRLEF